MNKRKLQKKLLELIERQKEAEAFKMFMAIEASTTNKQLAR